MTDYAAPTTPAEAADVVAKALRHELRQVAQERDALGVRMAALNDAVNVAETVAVQYRQHQPKQSDGLAVGAPEAANDG